LDPIPTLREIGKKLEAWIIIIQALINTLPIEPGVYQQLTKNSGRKPLNVMRFLSLSSGLVWNQQTKTEPILSKNSLGAGRKGEL
jgi:hypothetical protein